jgi:DNA-binding NarL/FixJ family response regulator
MNEPRSRSSARRTARPRILIADGEALVLEAFRALLDPEFEIVATVTNGQKLLTQCSRLKPDVVLLDVAMPVLSGLEAGRRLAALMPSVKLIFVTTNTEPRVVAEALRIGAAGYVLRSSAAGELRRAIRQAARGRSYISALLADVVGSFREFTRTLPTLTSRQREVLELLAEGQSMKEVASALNVTPRTVAFHKYKMMEQLHVKTNAELVRFAVRNGVVGQTRC